MITPWKSLLLVRHAKSSWDSTAGNDFDRPLNDRGKRDAPSMGRRLVQTGIEVDHLVSSPANRAKTTAEAFARELGIAAEEIVFIPELYHAHRESYYHIVAALDDKAKHVALFSHNPGITDFANSLTTTQIDNMPTCALFAVGAAISSWSAFADAEKKFLFFDYPKSLPGR